MDVIVKNILMVGTTTYLYQQSHVSSGNSRSERLSNLVLQAAYLTYLTGIVRSAWKVDAPRFAVVERGVYLATPVVMALSHMFDEERLPIPEPLISIYYGVSSAASIAIHFFNSMAHASLSAGMMAVAPLSQFHVVSKLAISAASAVCATFTYLSLATWVMESFDTLLKIATIATGAMIFLQKSSKIPKGSGRGSSSHTYTNYYNSYRYSGLSTGSWSGGGSLTSLSYQPYCLERQKESK